MQASGVTTNLYPLVSDTAKTATGTSVDFTGIPSWAKRITVMFDGVSTSGTSNLLLQIGDSGGIENTGYNGSAAYAQGAATSIVATSTAGFLLTASTSATFLRGGSAVLTLIGATTNKWSLMSILGQGDNNCSFSGGSKSLSATLDRIRVTTVNGTDTFDAGTINILYE